MTDILKEADFRKEIKAAPRAGYLFFGEEDYLKYHALRTARETLCPDPNFSFFNEMKLDAVEFTPDKLLDALMPMPMMADRKLVTVTGLNFTSMRPNEVDALCEVLAQLPHYDYNVLIVSVASDCFDPGYLPKRPSAVLTKLGEFLTPVNFEKCGTAKLTAWIGKHFQFHEVAASPEVCAFLTEYCGHSMFVLASEIDKVCYYLLSHGQTEATAETVRKVCASNSEYDAFAFANAIMEGKTETALAVLADYKFRRVDPLFILSDVIRVICDMIGVRTMTAEGITAAEIASAMKLHEFKVGLYQKSLRGTTEERQKRALDACVAADAALKLSPQGYTALEKLICSL